MMNRRRWITALLVICMILIDLCILFSPMAGYSRAVLWLNTLIEADHDMSVHLFYGKDRTFTEENSSLAQCTGGRDAVPVNLTFSADTNYLQINFGLGPGTVKIDSASINLGCRQIGLGERFLYPAATSGISGIRPEEDGVRIECDGDRPCMLLSVEDLHLMEAYEDANRIRNRIYLILLCCMADLILLLPALWLLENISRSTSSGQDRLFSPDGMHRSGRLSRSQCLIVALIFLSCLCGVLMIDPVFCPDEAGRRLLSRYIFESGRLPTGSEAETIMSGWGFSYALRPYLSAMIAAVFMKVGSAFSSSWLCLLVMSRMGSVLAVTGCGYFILRSGNEIFARRSASSLAAVIVCFCPQVMFLGMYQNNDSYVLLAAGAVIFFLIKGYRTHWSVSSCIGLAGAFSLCLLSYYPAAVWILAGCVFAVIAFIKDPVIDRKGAVFCRRAVLIVGICFLLAGWFFIRNAWLHQGDFLGILSERRSREALEAAGHRFVPFQPASDWGVSVFGFLSAHNYDWIRLTGRSLIGVFDHMLIYLPEIWYGVYYALLALIAAAFGLTFFTSKKSLLVKLLFAVLALANGLILLLSFLQSYYRDYQPQGRYVITLMLLFGFMAGYAAERGEEYVAERRAVRSGKGRVMQFFINYPGTVTAAAWMVMYFCIWFGIMGNMVI